MGNRGYQRLYEWGKRKEICIQLQIDPNIEEVWFDKQKCQTVLSNLLMNALKFSKANSNITVSTQRLETQSEYLL